MTFKKIKKYSWETDKLKIFSKNYTLRNFASNLTKIIIGGKTTGLHYLNFNKHIFQNLLYPNVYLSIFYFIFRKIIILIGKIKK